MRLRFVRIHLILVIAFTIGCAGSFEAAQTKSDTSNILSSNTPAGGDTTAPTVSITSPATNATVTGSTMVTVAAADNFGVTKVELYVDGTLFGSPSMASPFSISFNPATISNGTHILTVKAYDQAGNVGTSGAVSINVNVSSGGKGNPNASYKWIAANILTTCTGCHSGTNAPKGYRFDSYSNTLGAVIPGNYASSPLYTTTKSGSMPIGGPALNSTELQAIQDWITAGAMNN